MYAIDRRFWQTTQVVSERKENESGTAARLTNAGFGFAIAGVVALLVAFGIGMFEGRWPPGWAFLVSVALMALAAVAVGASFLLPDRPGGAARASVAPRVFVARSGGVIPMRTRLIGGAVALAIIVAVVALHGAT
ncbi:hypothetical protein [Antrihabitans cavernicola]|uniref:Uncharacterized protein n=1 Tax=Antrihabitans cavernicola TaxID=2495913 RepID=A0A5A7SCW4_9NOCA|nr:hypothetical protein [Spelaeibacter cavernicola]KAA0023219.1 hypothetical protein FOY51_07230 [Spelaeibacter cavernicola]